jgi:hypothetical protein
MGRSFLMEKGLAGWNRDPSRHVAGSALMAAGSGSALHYFT